MSYQKLQANRAVSVTPSNTANISDSTEASKSGVVLYVGTKDLSFGKGIHAIVEIGQIIDKEPTFDADFNIIEEATFLDGYHFDVMSEQEIDFGVNAITPTNPKHSFAGYE